MTDNHDNRRPQFAAEDYERRAGDLTNLPVSLTHVYAARDALRAAADLARECERLRAIIERDRTLFAEVVTNMRRRLQGVWWMTDSRGPYEWDDARYQKEFGEALQAIRNDLEPLEKRAADWSDSPRTQADVQAARTAESREAELRERSQRQLDGVYAQLDVRMKENAELREKVRVLREALTNERMTAQENMDRAEDIIYDVQHIWDRFDERTIVAMPQGLCDRFAGITEVAKNIEASLGGMKQRINRQIDSSDSTKEPWEGTMDEQIARLRAATADEPKVKEEI